MAVRVTPEQVDIWRAAPSETENLEFKEARNQFDNEKLYKYCVALANEGGGKLLLGTKDEPPRPEIGTNAFDSPEGISEKIHTVLRLKVRVEEVYHPDGRVVVFHIPSRPRGTAYSYLGAFYMRAGEALVPMTEDRLRSIFNEGQCHWLDVHIATGLTAEEVLSLLDYKGLFRLLDVPVPNSESVIERLIGERLVDKDGARFSVRRGGALLLANNLTDFPELQGKEPRVIRYSGSAKFETVSDQPGKRGYAVGFQGLVGYIVRHLPQNEAISDALRTKHQLIPENAVRELCANALIHQDFTIGGISLTFEVYDDRIEFTNPGTPIVPPERFIDGNQARNERFAYLMRKLRICEERGSGIDNVIRMAEFYQLAAPEFKMGHQTTIVTVPGPKPFQQMERDDRIRACYQHCALKYVMNFRMTNQTLRERFKLPETKSGAISTVINQTVDLELVKPDESISTSKKFAKYVPFWA